MKPERISAVALGALVAFCVAANGAHDYWAATAVYVAALGLFAVLALRSSWPEKGPGLSTAFLIPAAAAAAALTFSFLGSVRPEESWFALMDWSAALLAFLIARRLFRERRPLWDFAACAVPVVCAETAVILFQHFLYALAPDAPRGAFALFKYFISLQVPGTLVNSSAATAFYLLWTPVFAARALRGRSASRVPAYWAAGAAAAVLGLLLLDSNWGLVCLAAGVPLLAGPRKFAAWIRGNPRLARRAAAAGLAGVAALLAWKFGHTINMNGRPLPPGENTRRLYWWASGLRMLAAHPLLGVGLGNFASAYRAFRVGAVQNTLYPHNLAVELLAETGLLGFGAVAAFALSVLLRPELRGPEGEERWPFLLGLLLFALFGQIGLSIEYLVNLLCCGIFFGVLAAPASAPSWKPRRSVLLVAAAAALCAVPSLLAPFLADRLCVEGRRLLAAGRAADAVKEFSSAAETSPRSSVAQQGWAEALEASGDAASRPEIIAHRRRAIELNRLAGALWAELGRAQLAQGDSAGAQKSFETADALQFRPPVQR